MSAIKLSGAHVEKIDMTPTFEAAVRMCVLVLTNGTPAGQRMAEEELLSYGRTLDNLKASGRLP